MPPRTRSRGAGRPTAESQGGRAGRRVGRSGNARPARNVNEEPVVEPTVEPIARPETQGVGINVGAGGIPDLSTIIAQKLQDLLPTILAEVENQMNQPEVVIADNVRNNVGRPAVGEVRRSCTYKEFLSCSPKEYDGKGGAIAYTR